MTNVYWNVPFDSGSLSVLARSASDSVQPNSTNDVPPAPGDSTKRGACYGIACATITGIPPSTCLACREGLHVSEVLQSISNISSLIKTRTAEQSAAIESLNERIEKIESIADRPKGRTVRNNAEHKALAEYARTGSGLSGAESKSMTIGTSADGGASVPGVIANEIVSRALGAGGIASIVRQSTSASGNYTRVLNMRGQAAAWVAESGTRSASSNFKMRAVVPPNGELYANVSVSNWLLNDSTFDIGAMIIENASDQFARSLETAIYSGSGTDKPKGFTAVTPVTTTDAASPERAQDAIQYVAGTSDLANDLVGIYFKLKPEYRKNATWVMSSASLAVVRKLRDTSGSGFLFQENGRTDADFTGGTILGRPVVNCEDMPTGGGSPQTFAFFVGDWKVGYELVRIGDLTILRDPYTTKGFTSFYVAARFGGRLVDNDAVKCLKA